MSSRAAQQDGLTIAAVSEMLGIPVPTIRSWERRYGYPAPPRTNGRHRRYALSEVEQLRAIRDAIVSGHPARDAIALVRGEAEATVHPASDPRIEGLLRAAVDLEPNRARALLERSTEDLGVEAAIVEVAMPAMHEVGARWQAGTCDAANEHLLTDAVRAWLARLTVLAPPVRRRRPVVLACGPKELHSVGLEAFGVILVRRGRAVLQLGALTPGSSLRSTIERTSAVAAVVVAQRGVNRRSTVESIELAHRLLGSCVGYGGAAFASAAARRGVPGTYLGTDLVSAAGTIERLIAEPPSEGSSTGAA